MDEGDFAQLSCIVNSGDEPLTLTWAFHGDQVGPETGITTTNLGPRMSILIINSVGHKHQGKYACTAKNDAGIAVRYTELNVNGKSCSTENTVAEKKSQIKLDRVSYVFVTFSSSRHGSPHFWPRHLQ